MTQEALETATGTPPNPSDEQGAAGTDATADGSVTPPGTPSPTGREPDEAYKGLQRELAKRDKRLRELEAQVQQAASRPLDPGYAQVVPALIQQIAEYDPERAANIRAGYERWQMAQENQTLRTQLQRDEEEKVFAEASERNFQELRAIAAALGADPDSPSIDYGDDGEWLAERIAKVRASATASRAAAAPVTPPARNSADGTAHNTQPGTPPPAPSRNAPAVTDADVAKAQAEYSYAHQSGNRERIAAAEADLRDKTNRLAAQLFTE